MKLDRPTLQQLADWLAIAVVVSLPWSTSATLALIVLWLIAVLPALDVASIRRELSTAAGGLPVLPWVLAAIGMLWADVSFADRIDGLGGFHRLLAIPVLLAQFRRSDYGRRACSAFLISAIVMLALSWILALMPKAAAASVPVFGRHFALYGVPAKDYIFQSSVFLICAMALIAAASAAPCISRCTRYQCPTSTPRLVKPSSAGNTSAVTTATAPAEHIQSLLSIAVFLY